MIQSSKLYANCTERAVNVAYLCRHFDANHGVETKYLGKKKKYRLYVEIKRR